MSRKSARKMTEKSDKTTDTLAKMLAGVIDKAKAAAAEQKSRAAEGDGMAPPADLPKPTSQAIHDDRLVWAWEHGTHAGYERDTGEYYVRFEPREFALLSEKMTADLAKQYGEELLAAYVWQAIWQKHVGEYLVGEPVTAKKLAAEIVSDDDDIMENFVGDVE